MIVTVQVTAEDIRLGLPGECSRCPIAYALLRLLPEPIAWHAGPMSLHVRNKDRELLSMCVPVEARDFMYSFDRGQPVDPFSFEVEMIEELEP